MTLVLGMAAITLVAAWFVLAEPRDPAGARRLARRLGLRLDDALLEPVLARLGIHRWWEALGSGVGALVGAGLAWWEHSQGGDVLSTRVLGLLAAVTLGRAAGAVVAAWRARAVHLDATAPRVARTTAPRVEDYVSPLERWGGWAAAGVAALIAAGVAVAADSGALGLERPPVLLVVATVALPLATMGAFELVAARLLDRGQLARSPLELAWDDVLRAQTLREVAGAAIVVAAMFGLLTTSVAAEGIPGGWPENPGIGLVNGLILAVLGTCAVMAGVALAVRPERHVVRRLWREVPA